MVRSEQDSPFVVYHRAHRLSVLGKALMIGAPMAMLLAGMCIVGSMGTAQAETVTSTALPAIDPGSTVTPSPAPPRTRSASPLAASQQPPAPAVRTGPTIVRITITATGYQHEIDECQWVRMDLDAAAPIVGAHTRCGGSVVLAMRPGDMVELRGQGLDGRYVVVDGRDAHAGEDASVATSAMPARVILQTCYPGTGGRERLIALEPQS